MFQLPTWPAGSRRATSRAALETAINSALASAGGAEAVLAIPHAGDATAEINARLEAMAGAGGGTLRVRRARIGDPVRIGGRVQLRGDDCTLIFDSPIVMGPTGSLRIKGDLDEYWRGALDPATGTRVENTGAIPAVSVDTTDDPVTGNLVLQFAAGSGFVGQFQPGDMVVIRGFISPTRLAAIEKQTAFVASVDAAGNRLILDRPRALHTRAEEAAEMGRAVGDPFTFRYRYYPPGAPELPENELPSPTGEGAMATRVKILRTSLLPADKAPGGHRVTVADASGFQPGDLVHLSDDRREVDINPARNFLNLVNMEILTVVAVEGNDLVFEAPTRREYLTAFAARATRIAPVRRSHIRVGRMRWDGMQLSRQFHALQVDYGAQCTLTAGVIDGRGGRTAQAMRLSNSHDCHALGGLIEGAAGTGSGEGYGATLYYSTACTVRNLRLSGQRHSILFQGTTFCAAIANSSTDDLITAIDTHGTACIGTVIAHNTIRGGARNTVDATRHTGIRIGNSSHVIPDRETLVFGNRIEGYLGPDDAAMDVVPPSADVLFAANEAIDCTRGLRASGLNAQNAREVMAGVQARDNRFLRCDVGVEFLSTPLMGIRDVTLIANSFTACRQPVRARGFEAEGFFTAAGNLAQEPVDATAPMFGLEGIAAVTVTGGNVAPALDLAVRLRDCPGARITGNGFGPCARAVERPGDTAGAITGDNGVTGSPTGARLERIATGLAMPLEVAAVIPHNNSAPSPADGTSVLVATIATRPGEGLLVEALLPYVRLSGSTGAVTAHLFTDGAAVASTTERITTGGSSGSPIRLVARLTATGTALALDLRLGPSSAGPILTVGAKFDGGADPHLILHRDPASPADGDRYIVGAGATGDWAGWDLNVALWTDGAWLRLPPRTGWRAWIEDEGLLLVYDGAGWVGTTPDALQNLTLLGLGTMADASNPFSAKLNAALWTARTFAEGGTGDLFYTMNKEAAGGDLGLTLQTGFVTKAMVGLFGSDRFRLAVSTDGSTFFDGLSVDNATGIVDQPRLPRFKAYTNYDNYVGIGTWTKIGLNNTDYNDQGAFDAANNHFVALVDGTYLFGATLLYKINASATARMRGRLVLNDTTEIRGSLGEISATHVSLATAIWLQTMVPLTAGDTVEHQGSFRAADGYVAADHTSFWGAKIG